MTHEGQLAGAPAEPVLPSRAGAALFRAKAALFQIRRGLANAGDPAVRRHPQTAGMAQGPVLGESVSPLYRGAEAAELWFETGKVHNLRLAVRRLDGARVPAGAVFSFWRQIGRTSRWRGYVPGRELREGCVIPSIGGGLCQLSNALYDAALQAGFTVIERHRHSRVLPGSLAEFDRDATVFWNYVDLRFRSGRAFRISARLSADTLTVRLIGEAADGPTEPVAPAARVPAPVPRPAGHSPNDCLTCNGHGCFRKASLPNLDMPAAPAAGAEASRRTAWLVDAVWPEFDRFAQATRGTGDTLMLPLDGRRWDKPNYGWDTAGFTRVVQRPALALWRGLVSRRLAAQGAARQRAVQGFEARLAASFARALAPEIRHVVVTQALLPHLWRGGHLGGRSFDVLMTRWPMATLQAILDDAAALHPDSPTLRDFRADPALVAA